MKKILFCVICVFSYFSIVNAKTQIEYDWGRYVSSDRFFSSGLLDGNLGTIFYTPYNREYDYFLYDRTGEVTFFKCDYKDEEIIAINNQLISVYYDYNRGGYYQRVYDKNFNLIKETESFEDFYDEYADEFAIKGVTDKYYYIYDYIFDKETNEFIDIWNVVENNNLYNEFLDYDAAGNFEMAERTLLKIYAEEFPNTSIFVYFLFDLYFPDSYDLYDFSFDQNGNLALILYDYNYREYFITVFDSDYNELYDINVQTGFVPHVFFRNNKLYVVELRNARERLSAENEYDYKVIMSEYDSEGNFIDNFNLTNMFNETMNDYYWGREIYDVIETHDGFYLLTHNPFIEPQVMDPTLNEGDVISDVYPSIQKFSFVYNVETKESENGTIKVDKDSSKNGDKITYTVEPKEGYKLDKVIVTDENGNQVIITDSSFTMPNSNVTIEAIFVVDNPNTSVFIRIGIFVVIVLLTYYFVIFQNIKVRKFE